MKQPFETAVVEHAATVLRVCRAVLGAHTDAEDASAETLLAALEAWPDLPDHTNVEAWLVRVAHRKALDVVRRRQRHAIPVEQTPDRVSTLGIPDSTGRDLWAAVARLPDKQRRVIAYHYLGGLPYAEIADLLGGTADAARRAAADGIQALRAAHATPELRGSLR